MRPSETSWWETSRFAIRLVRLARPYWPDFWRCAFLAGVSGVTQLAPAVGAKQLIDTVYTSRDFEQLTAVVFSLFIIGCLGLAVSSLRGYVAQVLGARVGMSLEAYCFDHWQRLPSAFFDQRQSGEIVSRLSEARTTPLTLANTLLTLSTSLVQAAVMLPVMLWMHWRLTLVALALIPPVVILTWWYAKRLRIQWMRAAELRADVTAVEIDLLAQVRTLKALSAESHAYQMVWSGLRRSSENQLQAAFMSARIALATGLFRATSTAAVTWYGWSLVLKQELTLGTLVAFTVSLGLLTGPLSQIANALSAWPQTSATLARVFQYLDTSPEAVPSALVPSTSELTSKSAGEIVLQNVSLTYPMGRTVLRDVNLRICPGSTVALVGRSGAGKSSLLRLLVRIIDPTKGVICLDGMALEDYRLSDLRKRIVAVWQDASLIRGSVWDNLTIGVPESNREAVAGAVQVCRLDQFIETLPEKYDATIAEAGASLSGGQRQRFALARGALRDPDVLLLDEVTSQIDTETEREILTVLFAQRAAARKTTVFATHRLQLAQRADQIVVVDDGCILDQGTHQDLAERSHVYRTLLQ